jgi:hypothetical protein
VNNDTRTYEGGMLGTSWGAPRQEWETALDYEGRTWPRDDLPPLTAAEKKLVESIERST